MPTPPSPLKKLFATHRRKHIHSIGDDGPIITAEPRRSLVNASDATGNVDADRGELVSNTARHTRTAEVDSPINSITVQRSEGNELRARVSREDDGGSVFASSATSNVKSAAAPTPTRVMGGRTLSSLQPHAPSTEPMTKHARFAAIRRLSRKARSVSTTTSGREEARSRNTTVVSQHESIGADVIAETNCFDDVFLDDHKTASDSRMLAPAPQGNTRVTTV